VTALTTWARWIEACVNCGGSTNGIRDAGGTWYYIDPTPRQLQNGAIVGRLHMHKLGHGMVDLGAFKIAADGRVLQIPEEVAALFPGREPAPQLEQQPEISQPMTEETS
jgi:hypothetical protein